jgi:transcription elongation factor GreB
VNKAFVKETEGEEPGGEPGAEPGDDARSVALPGGAKNYMTPQGHARLKAELLELIDRVRPEVVGVVAWAASNGDRSENGDYIYGKRRLREIDRRIRFLGKRLDAAEVVDPACQLGNNRVYFGACVKYLREGACEEEVTIVGVDEVDPGRRHVSWISPIASALLRASRGDVVTLHSPGGLIELEIVDVDYAWTTRATI